ncbi:hypothetical protein SNOG_01752 [Parastagonospora nodorum SN15]|uniref:Uncharacterized protein n=1 Tax=Phaeosphaeria nodorum (strain SN15 / ATCC MYA-4574 / FGSC 10173) TaxID=321614 RepID=Q0V2L2_PHANO|nr:hypothetical protein SNOG_01752 [Parastagonospora nodorum SN15]EAT91401.1 hypothetical protein SNOG_01752 [Parastagonospora nodorum SN15]
MAGTSMDRTSTRKQHHLQYKAHNKHTTRNLSAASSRLSKDSTSSTRPISDFSATT